MKLLLSAFLLVLSTSAALNQSFHDSAHSQRELKHRTSNTPRTPKSSKTPKTIQDLNRNLKTKKTEILHVYSTEEKNPNSVRENTKAESSKAPKATRDGRRLTFESTKKGKSKKFKESTKAPMTKKSSKPPKAGHV